MHRYIYIYIYMYTHAYAFLLAMTTKQSIVSILRVILLTASIHTKKS